MTAGRAAPPASEEAAAAELRPSAELQAAIATAIADRRAADDCGPVCLVDRELANALRAAVRRRVEVGIHGGDIVVRRAAWRRCCGSPDADGSPGPEGVFVDLIGVPGDPQADLALLARPGNVRPVAKGGDVVKPRTD